jgi:hypothetical protein
MAPERLSLDRNTGQEKVSGTFFGSSAGAIRSPQAANLTKHACPVKKKVPDTFSPRVVALPHVRYELREFVTSYGADLDQCACEIALWIDAMLRSSHNLYLAMCFRFSGSRRLERSTQ